MIFLYYLIFGMVIPNRTILYFLQYYVPHIYILACLCFIVWCIYKKIVHEPITVPIGQRSFSNFFSLWVKGRISRMEYWLSWIVFWLIFGVFANSSLASMGGGIIGLIVSILLLYFIFVQSVKRCHDKGYGGWMVLIPFIDLFLLFSDGDDCENDYGPDPKGRGESDDDAEE